MDRVHEISATFFWAQNKEKCLFILFEKVPHQLKCVPNDIFWIPDPSLVYNQPSAARERERAREIGQSNEQKKVLLQVNYNVVLSVFWSHTLSKEPAKKFADVCRTKEKSAKNAIAEKKDLNSTLFHQFLARLLEAIDG